MDAKIAYLDFSKIHLTKAEWKLLCAITVSPKRKIEQPVEAERLCALGLAELYLSADKDSKVQSLFSTALGNEYVEYYRRRQRSKWILAAQWLIPLVLSAAALVISIMALNGGGGTARTRTTTTNSNPAFTATTNSNTGAARTNTAQTPQQSNTGGASQEPAGAPAQTGNAAPGQQQNGNAPGGATQEPAGAPNGQNNSASGGASS